MNWSSYELAHFTHRAQQQPAKSAYLFEWYPNGRRHSCIGAYENFSRIRDGDIQEIRETEAQEDLEQETKPSEQEAKASQQKANPSEREMKRRPPAHVMIFSNELPDMDVFDHSPYAKDWQFYKLDFCDAAEDYVLLHNHKLIPVPAEDFIAARDKARASRIQDGNDKKQDVEDLRIRLEAATEDLTECNQNAVAYLKLMETKEKQEKENDREKKKKEKERGKKEKEKGKKEKKENTTATGAQTITTKTQKDREITTESESQHPAESETTIASSHLSTLLQSLQTAEKDKSWASDLVSRGALTTAEQLAMKTLRVPMSPLNSAPVITMHSSPTAAQLAVSNSGGHHFSVSYDVVDGKTVPVLTAKIWEHPIIKQFERPPILHDDDEEVWLASESNRVMQREMAPNARANASTTASTAASTTTSMTASTTIATILSTRESTAIANDH